MDETFDPIAVPGREPLSSDPLLSDSLPSDRGADLALLQRASTGDEHAFDELYHRFETPLYNYILRLIHEPPVAEDLLQEVFVAAWNGASGFRGLSGVKTWLFHIAHNRTVSWLREHRRTLVYEDLRVSSEQDGPEQVLIQALSSERMKQALDGLSPEHRAVVELAFYQDLPYSEIAAIIGCPVGTVKSRMSYARRYLNHLLRDLAQEEDLPPGQTKK
ncbi:MAG TPA: sigma-70 family RNA polymerase sigma factor [Anaerolineales bacterium]